MVWILKLFKRFLQWTLGCTYAKKTIRNRIRDMFYFTEAPHIVIYEISEHEPWWTKLGLILGILISVMLIYYLLELAFQTARRLIHQYLTTLETHSTISTPRCLSPTKSMDKIRTPISKKSRSSKKSGRKQKVRMNEPVNCVFIRPSSSKLHTPPVTSILSAEKDEPNKTPSDNSARKLVNSSEISKKPSAIKNTPPEERGKSGSDELETVFLAKEEEPTPKIMLGNIMEWLAAQNLETETDQESMMQVAAASAAAISPISVTENVSEMSMMASTATTTSSNDSNWTERYVKKHGMVMAKSPTFDEVDVIIDDNHLFSDNEDENFGNVLLKEGQSKVLFRWTETDPESVEKVTLGGSFFGWNMTVPMRQHQDDVRIFTANLELPVGLHEYCIRVGRFSS